MNRPHGRVVAGAGKHIRLTVPSIEEDDLEAVRATLASGYLVQGERVTAFESAVADYLGVEHAVAVSSGTAALYLSLLSLGVGTGDLVLVPTYSWPATANVVELCDATPVFVEIQPDTFNMDADALKETLENLEADPATAQRKKAVLPVHTFGQMADMVAICRVAERYGVLVVEDAACALGACLGDRLAGRWGILGCFSFHPRKAITTGEGGMVVTDDPQLARTIQTLRNHGLDPHAPNPEFVRPGFNYRLTEMQAALGQTQLAKLERIISARRRGAAAYDRLLSDSPLVPPATMPEARHIYQSYVALLPAEVAGHRQELMQEWGTLGVELTVGTVHIPLTTYYRNRYGFDVGNFPVTDDIAARSVTLPLYENIDVRSQERVVEVVCDRVT